jgi:L-lactate dehydrogenase complex protein LldG
VEPAALSAAREAILRRVREARPESAPPIARDYRRAGALDAEERTALFCERVGEYSADVRRCAERDVAGVIAWACAERGARRLVVPTGVPQSWRSAELELVADEGMSARELDASDGALTGCTVAIAETGSIVLTGGASEGRRAITLVPDLHVCVVREADIVELLPEALARIERAGLERRPITFVSGPSATSDIELSRVEGVHGPRNLVVLVVKESP